MAVEIIKKGTPPAERLYEVTCHNCTSVLRFKRADAETVSDQRDGDFLRLACPVCQQSITLGLGAYLKTPLVGGR